MRKIVVALIAICLVGPTATHVPVAAQDSQCSQFDSWIWAQTELAPTSKTMVCGDLPLGFAPVTWTDHVPRAAVEADYVSMTDGDTLTVLVNGREDTVRLYRANAPEVDACGGSSATTFSEQVMRYNENGSRIYLESDETERDRYDRRLAYVWLEIDGHPYMLNEALIRSGYAVDQDYGDRLYSSEFGQAAAFAKRWGLGIYAECAEPEPGPAPAKPTETPPGPGGGTCDPSYPTVCIPLIEVSGDLDCGDIPYGRFEVIPPDPHGFDGDGDGVGCESG